MPKTATAKKAKGKSNKKANRSGYVHFRFDDDYEESLRFDQLRTLNQTKLEELGMTFLESTTRNYTREVLWLFPLVYSRE